MIVSLPGVTSCQLFWVEVDGQFELAVLLLPPLVEPQPASVSSASDAAMTMPPTLRNGLLERIGADGVCRESMCDIPPTVVAGDEVRRRGAARDAGAHIRAPAAQRVGPVVALVYHVEANDSHPRPQAPMRAQ